MPPRQNTIMDVLARTADDAPTTGAVAAPAPTGGALAEAEAALRTAANGLPDGAAARDQQPLAVHHDQIPPLPAPAQAPAPQHPSGLAGAPAPAPASETMAQFFHAFAHFMQSHAQGNAGAATGPPASAGTAAPATAHVTPARGAPHQAGSGSARRENGPVTTDSESVVEE